MPSAYNNNMQLFQTEDNVFILNEMVHDARIIPLESRGHLPSSVQQWNGDSRGRWDGDTLAVESRNFTDRRASFEPNALMALGWAPHCGSQSDLPGWTTICCSTNTLVMRETTAWSTPAVVLGRASFWSRKGGPPIKPHCQSPRRLRKWDGPVGWASCP